MLGQSKLSIILYDLSSWLVRRPDLAQACGLVLALGLALGAAFLAPGTAVACPACGGGSGGG